MLLNFLLAAGPSLLNLLRPWRIAIAVIMRSGPRPVQSYPGFVHILLPGPFPLSSRPLWNDLPAGALPMLRSSPTKRVPSSGALPLLAAWWFAVVRETALASAGDRMQFMGVHQSSGQSSWPLYPQMNHGRHLLLSHSVMQSLRLRIPPESAGTSPVPGLIRPHPGSLGGLRDSRRSVRGFRSCGRRCACPQMRTVAWTEVTATARVVIPA